MSLYREYRCAAHSIYNLKYSVPKNISIVFRNGFNYDYHFIIKELAEVVIVPIEKEVTRINKNADEVTKNISYIIQFIDSTSFMASSLSNLGNNLSKGIYRIKCKYGHDDKNCETCGIKHKYCDCDKNCVVTKIINTSLMEN